MTQLSQHQGSSSVTLVDSMGDDRSVVNAARVSYGKESTELTERDKKLIRYLAQERHMSPFRHVQFTLEIECPEFVARQLYKHQVGMGYTSADFRESATVWNEISGRYVTLEPSYYIPDIYRMQSPESKQASYGRLDQDVCAEAATLVENAVLSADRVYRELLSLGVAREQARIVLPLAMLTRFRVTASLEALVNLIRLRTHPHAQAETREVAEMIRSEVEHVCPVSLNALLVSNNKEYVR